ncbi:uncharacterized protein CTRU02_209441 [Colletotrichum truncatum]|uniref:Uncharacterized protein n=1 Tax=Colletotrichum truncatum TaxID=5467 RepID=A0ACC3YSD6_COLTU
MYSGQCLCRKHSFMQRGIISKYGVSQHRTLKFFFRFRPTLDVRFFRVSGRERPNASDCEPCGIRPSC